MAILKYYLEDLHIVIDFAQCIDMLMEEIANYRRLDILNYLLSAEKFLPKSHLVYSCILSKIPIITNDLELLKSVSSALDVIDVKQRRDSDLRSPALALDNAVRMGRINMIEWLLNNRPAKELVYHHCYECAVESANLEMLQYLVENNVKYTLNVDVRHVVKKTFILELGINLMDRAVRSNRLDIVKYLHDNKDLTSYASLNLLDYASECDLDLIDWLHKNRQNEGCTLRFLQNAALHGRFDVIQWAHINRIKDAFGESIMRYAAMGGHLNIIQWLHENRTGDQYLDVMDHASNLEIIKWLHFNRTDEYCTPNLSDKAASKGDLETIIWVYENHEVLCTRRGFEYAVLNGHLETLQWLHENCTFERSRIPWEWLLYLGEKQNHFHIVSWLYENRTAKISIHSNFISDHLIFTERYEIIKWLFEDLIKLPNIGKIGSRGHLDIITRKMVSTKHLDMFQWLSVNLFSLEQLQNYRDQSSDVWSKCCPFYLDALDKSIKILANQHNAQIQLHGQPPSNKVKNKCIIN